MADLPVWLDDCDHECCGESRHVGQRVRLWLAFSRAGTVEPASGPDQIIVPGDGTVTITGAAGGKTGLNGPFGHGTLVQSGSVQFAIHGDPPAPRVRCVGELYEGRHGVPAGTTTGQLVAIRWCLAICETSADGQMSTVVGHEPGIELATTDDWRRHAPQDDPLSSWAFEFTIRVSD